MMEQPVLDFLENPIKGDILAKKIELSQLRRAVADLLHAAANPLEEPPEYWLEQAKGLKEDISQLEAEILTLEKQLPSE